MVGKFENCCLPIYSCSSGHSAAVAGAFPLADLLGCYPVSILAMCCHGDMAFGFIIPVFAGILLSCGEKANSQLQCGKGNWTWSMDSEETSSGAFGLGSLSLNSLFNKMGALRSSTNQFCKSYEVQTTYEMRMRKCFVISNRQGFLGLQLCGM